MFLPVKLDNNINTAEITTQLDLKGKPFSKLNCLKFSRFKIVKDEKDFHLLSWGQASVYNGQGGGGGSLGAGRSCSKLYKGDTHFEKVPLDHLNFLLSTFFTAGQLAVQSSCQVRWCCVWIGGCLNPQWILLKKVKGKLVSTLASGIKDISLFSLQQHPWGQPAFFVFDYFVSHCHFLCLARWQ